MEAKLTGLLLTATLAVSAVSEVSAATFYFHTDHLGTPQVVTDQSQNVVWQGEYGPFGEVTASVEDVEQNLRFPGQYFDQETGLYYNYFRSYDPNTGRYLKSDPIGLKGGMSTYAYVGGNPLKYNDSFGLAVFICGRPADLPFPFGMFNHEWILTDTNEAGMGPAAGNNAGGIPAQNGNSDLPYSPVQVVDHTNQSLAENARCDHVENIDEACVNSLLEIGRSLGRFGPTNNCQTFTTEVIRSCGTN